MTGETFNSAAPRSHSGIPSEVSMDDVATPHKDGSVILARCLNHQTVDRKSAQSAHTRCLAGQIAALRTDIEQRAPFPVVGGGWITRARKIPIIPGRSASIGITRAQGNRGS